jgi:uncharacterized protein (TIGR03083 family)
MTGVDPDWRWLKSEVTEAAAAFSQQLLQVADTSVRVPNLEWSVADLAAHLISLPDVYHRLDDLGEAFEAPPDWDEFSRQARAHVTEVDPRVLGESLEQEARRFVEDLGPEPSATYMLYGLPTTVGNVAAGYLGELLVHGQDLGRLTGIKVGLDGRQAMAIARQYMTLAPAFVDATRARAAEGTYHVRLRGGTDYTYRVHDGTLTVVEGKPEHSDAHLVADPTAFVLVSLGRISSIRAGLTGKVFGYGRRPWLLRSLARIRADGV